jgi:hypothetical protein
LEGSRLQRESAFRESLTGAERRLAARKQTALDAWNMLSTVNASELANPENARRTGVADVPQTAQQLKNRSPQAQGDFAMELTDQR